MSVSSEVTRIKTNISNAYTELKNKNATIPDVENSENLSSAIASIKTGGGTVEKGIIINEYDSEGYVIDASLVGFTRIRESYFQNFFYKTGLYGSPFSRIGANLHISDDVNYIDSSAFRGSNALKITSLPDAVTYIGYYAFQDCSELALTKLPANLESIQTEAFRNCTKLALTELPDKLVYVQGGAFRGCTNMPLTKLGANTRLQNGNNFYGCKQLNIKNIPANTLYIPEYCFYQCTGLTELTIEGAISSIQQYAFGYCSNLSKLVLANVTSVPTLSNINAFSSTPIASGTGYIYVPDALVESFKASNWSTYASQIKGLGELPKE